MNKIDFEIKRALRTQYNAERTYFTFNAVGYGVSL